MKFYQSVVALTVMPNKLNIDSPYSIRNVAATLAFDAMKYYNGNVSSDPIVSFLRPTKDESPLTMPSKLVTCKIRTTGG
jgi:hypothetical protein